MLVKKNLEFSDRHTNSTNSIRFLMCFFGGWGGVGDQFINLYAEQSGIPAQIFIFKNCITILMNPNLLKKSIK